MKHLAQTVLLGLLVGLTAFSLRAAEVSHRADDQYGGGAAQLAPDGKHRGQQQRPVTEVLPSSQTLTYRGGDTITRAVTDVCPPNPVAGGPACLGTDTKLSRDALPVGTSTDTNHIVGTDDPRLSDARPPSGSMHGSTGIGFYTTVTVTLTATRSATGTETATATGTHTGTISGSSTFTATGTSGYTDTLTTAATLPTSTVTDTFVVTGTETATGPLSSNKTFTWTSTSTSTATRTVTGTATVTQSIAGTATVVVTNILTATQTGTQATTGTTIVTGTGAVTGTGTATGSGTSASGTVALTGTVTATGTATLSVSTVASQTATRTVTAENSETQNVSGTRTATYIHTFTVASTGSGTYAFTDATTDTKTIYSTNTITASGTLTATSSVVASGTVTGTATAVAQGTVTGTGTGTGTNTAAVTYTQTATATGTKTSATYAEEPTVLFEPDAPVNALLKKQADGSIGASAASEVGGQLQVPEVSGNSSGKFGRLELQTIGANAAWVCRNLYWDGSHARYRVTGDASCAYLNGSGSFQLVSFDSGSAGAMADSSYHNVLLASPSAAIFSGYLQSTNLTRAGHAIADMPLPPAPCGEGQATTYDGSPATTRCRDVGGAGSLARPVTVCASGEVLTSYSEGASQCVANGTGSNIACAGGSCTTYRAAMFINATSIANAPLTYSGNDSYFTGWAYLNGGAKVLAVSDGTGWLHNNGSGTYAWSTPNYADVGATPDNLSITPNYNPVAVTYDSRGRVTGAQSITPTWIGAIPTAGVKLFGTVYTNSNPGYFETSSTSWVNVFSVGVPEVVSGLSYGVKVDVAWGHVESTCGSCSMRLLLDSTAIGNETYTEMAYSQSSISAAADTSAGASHGLYAQIKQGSGLCYCRVYSNTVSISGMVAPKPY